MRAVLYCAFPAVDNCGVRDIGLAPLVSAQKWPKDTAMSLSKPPVYLHVPSEQAAAKTTVQPLGPSSSDDCLPCFSVTQASEPASPGSAQLAEQGKLWRRGRPVKGYIMYSVISGKVYPFAGRISQGR